MTWPGADPDSVSWAWTGLAALAAVGAFVAGLRLPSPDRSGRAFWWASTLLVLVLAVNKELDLHSWVLTRGRDNLALPAWLEYGGDNSLVVVVCLTVVAATAAATPLVLGRVVARFPLAALGLSMLLAYVVIATLELSRMTPSAVPQPPLSTVIEFSGVIAILVGVVVAMTVGRRKQATRTAPRDHREPAPRSEDGNAPSGRGRVDCRG